MKSIGFDFEGRHYVGNLVTYKIGNQPDTITIWASFPKARINVFADYNFKDKKINVLPRTTPMPGVFPDFLSKIIGYL